MRTSACSNALRNGPEKWTFWEAVAHALLSSNQCGRGSLSERERICICGRHSRLILRYAVESLHHRKNHVHLRLARNATGKQRTGLATHSRKQGGYTGCQSNGLDHRQPPGRHHQRAEKRLRGKTVWYIRSTVSWCPIPAWGLRCWTNTTRISRFIMKPSGGQD